MREAASGETKLLGTPFVLKDYSNSKASGMADFGGNGSSSGQSDGRNGGSEDLRSLLRAKPQPSVSLSEDHIQSVLAVRRARSSILGEGLFSDPAWDIVLELYAAKLGHRKTSIEDLARVSGAPLSTTRRWITALEEQGLAKREQTRGSCIWISLTANGASKMERLANQWASAFVSI